MNIIPITQAEPISEPQSRNLPLAEAVAFASNDTFIDNEFKKLTVLRSWIDTVENGDILKSDEVDDILQQIFHLDLLNYKEQYARIQYANSRTNIIQSPAYLIGIGKECRSAAVSPNLYKYKYKDNTNDWVNEHYNALLLKIYSSSWVQKEKIIVEMGFTKNNEKEESLYAYAILIDKEMLTPILFAIKNDIKVIITDKFETKDGTYIEEEPGKWGWSIKKAEYKSSPLFARNNITFNKTEQYSSISTFVKPYVKFQIDWNELNRNATVLI
ncbi:MAG: hypothetical protein CXT73_04940 [Methanobacteriota archaeon]|nr:MAG: hypothetical protein CXT73_04940 [Euryarchaeota archaeon]